MKNKLQVFNYKGKDIRTVEKDGTTWWVLKDVCGILGIERGHRVSERLEKDEVGTFNVPHPQSKDKMIEMICVNESGLYNVILRSDKEEAKPFRKWVTSEVLPLIRKHGAYMTPEKLEEVLLNPDTMIKLCEALKSEQEKNKVLMIENSKLAVDKAIMKPKADYFDELVDRNLLTNFRDTAKELGINQNEFIKFLIDKKYIYRDNKSNIKPYSIYNGELFELKECYNEKTKWKGTQTLITPKGRETFRLLCLR